MVRSLFVILSILISGLVGGTLRAETFKLANGESITGELLAASANDQGVQIKTGDAQYQRVPWANFTQEDLKTFAKNAKLEPFVEPFIEITQAEKIKKTDPNIKQPPHLERPPRQSLFGAFFSSSLGIFLMLLLYAATIYAGYEVAIFRARPMPVVCGLSAIPFLGFFAPIVFLAMPTRLVKRAEELEEPVPAEEASLAGAATAAPLADEDNPMQVAGAEHPASLKLHAETPTRKPALPETITYQRGQFTFNRRFFETKFPGFFGIVRREADRDLVLIIKVGHTEHIGQRISRISANDLHLEVHRGNASEEVMIPYQDIQLIRLKHKDAQG